MSDTHTAVQETDPWRWLSDATAYATDFGQRAILFSDVLRQRGNQYHDHLRRGQPPVLSFEFDLLVDGRSLDPPVNFDLARIRDRRDPLAVRPSVAEEKRHPIRPRAERRPVIIIDPRAGHGPGIGGSKRESEIGMALDQGYPVYVVLFSTWPVPGQTLEGVQLALARFVETVRERHPQSDSPAIVGNCQGGWATALLGAVRPDIVGPIVINGAPLSYWAGVRGRNPMRYKGGISGGTWLTSLFADLGNGNFDGAHLVANFEDLNPANSLWKKPYHLWANVDTEAERFLSFERWWNGYYMLSAEEIHFIVEQLFVENRPEQGTLEMNGSRIDLKNMKGPIVVFASRGDNITPPQQALNWIPAVWGSVDEIRRCGHTIVYMVHDTIGHLGIFVSGAVSRREHREIMASIDLIDYLSPGLYEMVIADDGDDRHTVRFEARVMADIQAMDDDEDDAASFAAVAAVSRFNDRLYHSWVSPWVKAAVGEAMAEALRQLHPLRVAHFAFSDRNPWMAPLAGMADSVRQQRRPLPADNPFLAVEQAMSETISQSLDLFRECRDQAYEWWFHAWYDNPWMRSLAQNGAPRRQAPARCEVGPDTFAAGGFGDALVRMLVAVFYAAGRIRRRHLAIYETLATRDERLAGLTGETLIETIRRQAGIVQQDSQAAINALPALLPTPEDRRSALAILSAVTAGQTNGDPRRSAMVDTIATVLSE